MRDGSAARGDRLAPSPEEMKRRSVTLVLLWQEYRAEQAVGYGYSRYCDLYGEWRKTISATMRQTHPAREKLFVDYAGDTVPVFDQTNSTERPAHIFVAALGASNYTYAEARWSEGLGHVGLRAVPISPPLVGEATVPGRLQAAFYASGSVSQNASHWGRGAKRAGQFGGRFASSNARGEPGMTFLRKIGQLKGFSSWAIGTIVPIAHCEV